MIEEDLEQLLRKTGNSVDHHVDLNDEIPLADTVSHDVVSSADALADVILREEQWQRKVTELLERQKRTAQLALGLEKLQRVIYSQLWIKKGYEYSIDTLITLQLLQEEILKELAGAA